MPETRPPWELYQPQSQPTAQMPWEMYGGAASPPQQPSLVQRMQSATEPAIPSLPPTATIAGTGGAPANPVEPQWRAGAPEQPSPLQWMAGQYGTGLTDFLGKAGGTANEVLQGLTGNFSDEIMAGVAAPLLSAFGSLSGNPIGVGDAYSQTVGGLREAQDQFRQEHPVLSGLGQVGGALATGVGAARMGLSPLANAPGGTGLLGMAGRGVGEGAAYGALYGAGAAEGNPLERLGSAGMGALGGAGIGGGLGAGMGAANRYLPGVASRIGVGPEQPPGGAGPRAPQATQTIDDLREQAGSLYQAVRQSNGAIGREEATGLWGNMKDVVSEFGRRRIPTTEGIFKEVAAGIPAAPAEMAKRIGVPVQTVEDAMRHGISIEGATMLRVHPDPQVAEQVARALNQGRVTTVARQDTEMPLNDLIDHIQNLREAARNRNLTPTDRLAARQLEETMSEALTAYSGPNAAILRQADEVWARVRGAELIEDLFEKATNVAARGSQTMPEALRAQFVSLANNSKRMRSLPQEIRQGITRIARQKTRFDGLLRAMSQLSPDTIWRTVASVGLGSYSGIPGGAVALPVLGRAARNIREGSFQRAAEGLESQILSGTVGQSLPPAKPLPMRAGAVAAGAGTQGEDLTRGGLRGLGLRR